ncbi:energy transducer TonB [Mucilaginibacter terrigena]|uniref:Energy transducer TonB n=1 Tax=Mucilaginibacter terrigena TaxID=2492395 RepID=A0A4Q5LSK0_9SPHI|nr:energy transducer TonB [Mucilaginibacter terrigena]RYU92359.1 energy transducer TonB [Mucilaginibacter terrigena]
MRSLLILTALCFSIAVKAQTADTTIKNVKLIAADSLEKKMKQPGAFTDFEHPPQFPGGHQEFAKYLMANLRYPAESYSKRIQGRVILSMIVEKDGTVDEVKIVKGVADDIDREAIRVLSNSPKWLPGVQKGQPVRVRYAVPLNFAL